MFYCLDIMTLPLHRDLKVALDLTVPLVLLDPRERRVRLVPRENTAPPVPRDTLAPPDLPALL